MDDDAEPAPLWLVSNLALIVAILAREMQHNRLLSPPATTAIANAAEELAHAIDATSHGPEHTHAAGMLNTLVQQLRSAGP